MSILSVFRYRGHFLPVYPLNHFAYPWGYAYPSLGTDALDASEMPQDRQFPDTIPEKTDTPVITGNCNMHAVKIDAPIVLNLDVVKSDEVNKNREEQRTG